MAIWQYKGELIPKTLLMAKYGQIPSVLENYIVIDDDIDLDAKEDPHWWREIAIEEAVFERMTTILPSRDSWSKDALMFGKDESSDFTIWFDDGAVDRINFRWDLREPNIKLLREFIDLASELESCIVSGDRATINEPDLQTIINDIEQSSAYRFCKDPRGFLSEFIREHKEGR